MELKEQILEVLEENKGAFVSGGALAERFFVSRNAVWKAVAVLKADGHRVTAVTNKGYRLEESSDILTAASVLSGLGDAGARFDVRVYDALSSTNTTLKELASKGAGEGTVVIAKTQTGGRGRMGRSFYSPPGSGVYFSLLLRPKLGAEDATLVTSAAAAAVSEALDALAGVGAEIKWVNDVYIRGKKVCGILTEGSYDMESGGMDYIVLGIGVNLTDPEDSFPDELRHKITSVFGASPEPAGFKSRLIAEILRRFMAFYENLTAKTYLNDYRDRSFLCGKRIEVIRSGQTRRARALAIDDDFRLLVRYDDGTEEALSSGEVSIIPTEED